VFSLKRGKYNEEFTMTMRCHIKKNYTERILLKISVKLFTMLATSRIIAKIFLFSHVSLTSRKTWEKKFRYFFTKFSKNQEDTCKKYEQDELFTFWEKLSI